jgi:hypothetical protein
MPSIISALVQKLPPNVRLTLYLLGFAVALFAPWLTSHGWISAVDSETLLQIAGVLTGGLAGVVLRAQKTVPPADQAIALAKAAEEKAMSSATAAASDLADLERVRAALTGAASSTTSLVEQAIDAAS